MIGFSDLSTRAWAALAYAAILFSCAIFGSVFLWVLLAISFGICVRELQKLLESEPATYVNMGILALGLVFLSLGVLRGYFGVWALVGFFALTFLFDTASYFGGRFFGGQKLIPSISPGKTRSGLYCGLGAVIIGAMFLLIGSSIWIKALFALILGFAFLGGDLLISYLKRRAAVKDTGDLIPGHGGLLDRMDSFLIAAPLYWLLLLSDVPTYG